MTTTANTSSSDYNLEKLTTKQLSAHLDYSIAAGSNVILIGRRGSGKTQIAKQRIQKSGSRELYVNLSVFERPDLAGIPRVFTLPEKDVVQKFVDYMLPRMYEPLLTGKQKVVALFDEVDKCDSSIWAALLEIVQYHSINGQAFPNLQSCIMTGNLVAEGGSKIHPPLVDRSEAYLLQADATSWLEWAGSSGEIHPSVFAFVQEHPQALFGKVDLGENYVDASPRAWHLASKIIKFGEDHNYDINLILEKVSGFVGKSLGIQYMTYYTHYQKLLPIVKNVFGEQDISAQYKALGPSEKNVVCMIVASRLANELDKHDSKKDQPECLRVIGKFFSQVEHENVVAALRSQVQLSRISAWKLLKNEHWIGVMKDLNSYTGVKSA